MNIKTEKKTEMKYLAVLALMMVASGQTLANAQTIGGTCVRPAGHLSEICGNATVDGQNVVIKNLQYEHGSIADSFFMYIKPRQISSRSICKAFLSTMNQTFETSTKNFGTVWEMYKTRSGKIGCRGHNALYQVTCENVSDL